MCGPTSKTKPLLTALAYYEPNKELILENDANEYGIGSAMMQAGKPVAFAIRSMSETERRYAQIEKEMLAVVYGLEKHHHYTYGRRVKIITDHKPLVTIVSKPLSKAPRRLQNLLLRSQKYDFELVYRPGKDIPLADALSRAPLPNEATTNEEYVSNLQYSPIKPSKLDEIRVATERDDTLKSLKSVIMTGWPEQRTLLTTNLTPYFSYRDELTVQDGLILRGDRIIIPTSLRMDIKKKLHVGHLGINSCLRRARQVVFWPCMSSEIRQYIESCDICARYAAKQGPEPLNMHEVPNRAWEKLGTDLFSLKGHTYLVTVDYYSNFIELDRMKETTSETVITKLKHHFARHGIPDYIISDGGPQYSSNVFAEFCEKYSIVHEMSSPGNSKANGAAEAAVKIMKNLLRKCHDAGEDPYIGLLNLRNTPTEGLTTSPVQRLFGRQTKTIIPTTLNVLKQPEISNDRDRMTIKKTNTAERYMNNKSLKQLNVGDTIRMQPLQRGEEIWKQATVTKQVKSRTYEVQTGNGRTYVRNRQHIKASVPARETEPKTPVKSPLTMSPTNIPKVTCETPKTVITHNTPTQLLEQHSNEQAYQTRTGRYVRKVTKLNL